MLESVIHCTYLASRCCIRSIASSTIHMQRKNEVFTLFDEGEGIEEDDGLPQDYKVMNINIMSRRLDTLISKATQGSTT